MTELALAAQNQQSGRNVSSALHVEAPKPIVVLKLGSSVISERSRIPEAVTEIYRIVRDGRRVLAVVSAFEGVTDRMLEDARALGCGHDNVHLPRYVALGEETSAALLTLACDRAGLQAQTLSVAQLGLAARGSIESAEPTGLDPGAIEQAFARSDVLVVPGYAALDPSGEVVLLGRGGTDLSAVYLAAELGAERVRLVKDVDGVYDRDPNSEDEALRFGAITWGEARDVAGPLIQGRALDFAEARGLVVEVGALGRDDATVVGPRGAPPVRRRRPPRLKVALAGCGVVGGGVLARLKRRPEEFEIAGVLVRDADKPREGADAGDGLTADEAAFLANEADVVVDVLSSAEVGARVSEQALRTGAHVVSANKQAVVASYGRLLGAAFAGGSRLLYSAAVGGGAPLIETVRLARGRGGVASFEGVLNGTVNFVLGRLAAGESLEEALKGARVAGLAEEDPSADLEGLDAAAKLQILAFEAFGETLPLADIEREALDASVAHAAGLRSLKQIGRVERTGSGLRASVRFLAETPFTGLRSDRNALRVTGSDGVVWSARGRGAGRWPTTESVLADLVDLHAGLVA
jgi:homoserine dehydrogenase